MTEILCLAYVTPASLDHPTPFKFYSSAKFGVEMEPPPSEDILVSIYYSVLAAKVFSDSFHHWDV